MSELVHYDVADEVATLTLDSPHNRNALSRQLVGETFEGLDRAEADDTVKVVLLRSADRVFCSGADLSEATGEGMAEGAKKIVELQRRIVASPKPVVVRLDGPVRAGGIGIVAASDIAIASTDAGFALTEVKLGRAAATPRRTGWSPRPCRAKSSMREWRRCAASWPPAPRRGCASRRRSSTATSSPGSTPTGRRWPPSAPACSPPTRRAQR